MQTNQPLPEGFELEGFRIERVLARGGFSFVYLAYSEVHGQVALKEYLPAWLALRTGLDPWPTVDDGNSSAFRHGLRCFFEEGRALADLRHPNVVRVLDFFRANGTAYLVMHYERGRSLQEQIAACRGSTSEDWIRKTFGSLLTGLREVHATMRLHLDIKPGNIFIRDDGVPVLVDFGAARNALSSDSAALDHIFTPGFAAPEQDGTPEALGPWTDIYSVGATLYACIAATPPPRASERSQTDDLTAALRQCAEKYSRELLDIVAWCLRLDPEERPPSVLALQKALRGEVAPCATAA